MTFAFETEHHYQELEKETIGCHNQREECSESLKKKMIFKESNKSFKYNLHCSSMVILAFLLGYILEVSSSGESIQAYAG